MCTFFGYERKHFIVVRYAFGTGVVEYDPYVSRRGTSAGSSRGSRADREAELMEMSRAADKRARRAEEVARQASLWMAACMQVSFVMRPYFILFCTGTEFVTSNAANGDSLAWRCAFAGVSSSWHTGEWM